MSWPPEGSALPAVPAVVCNHSLLCCVELWCCGAVCVVVEYLSKRLNPSGIFFYEFNYYNRIDLGSMFAQETQQD